MTMTTMISHTIRCDTPWCMTRALGTDHRLQVRAAILEVNDRKLFAADAIEQGWECDNPHAISARATISDTFDRLKWKCPVCVAAGKGQGREPAPNPAPTPELCGSCAQPDYPSVSAKCSQLRGHAGLHSAQLRDGGTICWMDGGPIVAEPKPANAPHSFRCACFRGPAQPWGPMEDCTCGLRVVGQAIVKGTKILVWNNDRWRPATVVDPATQFDGHEFTYDGDVSGEGYPHARMKVSRVGDAWLPVPKEPTVPPDPASVRFPTTAENGGLARDKFCSLLHVVPGASWDGLAEVLRRETERIEKHRDRLTALLALDNFTSWENIVRAVDQLVLDGKKPSPGDTGWFGPDPRARDIAWAAWDAARPRPASTEASKDKEAFDRWYEWKDKHL